MTHPSFVIIGHRGAAALAPENTRAAIRAAARSGAQMVELDVQMTRDGRLVVFHDDRLGRTTNGRGEVRRTRYPQLARWDAGAWFHPRFAGERVPLVSQALRLIPARMRINLELKPTRQRRALLRRLLRLVRRAGVSRRTLISSSDLRLLRPLRSSGLALALICARHPERSIRQAVRLGCRAWHPLHTVLTPPLVTAAHERGLRVHAWTVDDQRRARRLIRWGVDGVFTNDPARLRTLR